MSPAFRSPRGRAAPVFGLVVAVSLSAASTIVASPAHAANEGPTGTWKASADSVAGNCRITLTDAAVEGTPYRNARRIDFPNGRAACAGTWLEKADMWVLEKDRLRLGQNVGPGRYRFVPLKRTADGRWRHPVVTLTRAE